MRRRSWRIPSLLTVSALLLGLSVVQSVPGNAANTFSLVKITPIDPTAPSTGPDAYKRWTGAEPSITTGPEGNLYMSAPGSGMLFARSTDNGATWTVPTKRANSSSGDTSINVDSSGAVYQTDLNGNSGVSTLQGDVYKSTDFGDTWSPRGTGFASDGSASNQPFLVDREWADAYIPPGKTTNDALVYFMYHDWGPNQIWVNTSKDGGKTFGPPVSVMASPAATQDGVTGAAMSEGSTFCNSIPGNVKVVQSGPHAGRVYVGWLAADVVTNLATGCNATQMDTFHSVWIAWSDDEGQTWTTQRVFDGGPGHDASDLFADLTLDNQGNPYMAFGDNLTFTPGDATATWGMYVMGSQVASAKDAAPAWSGPFLASADGQSTAFPAIAVGDPGKVDVAYLATDQPIDALPYGKPKPGGGAGHFWNLFMSQTLDLFAADGTPSWEATQATSEPMHKGDVCTLGIFCIGAAGSNRNLLDFIDVTLDPAGYAHVAYTDDWDAAGQKVQSPREVWSANQTGGTSVLGLPTALSLRANRHAARAVLRNAATRAPIAGVPIEFSVNGTHVGTRTTGPHGRASLHRLKLVAGDVVTAVFAGTSTLNGSQAEATVRK